METKPRPTFDFPNQVSPRYIEPIFLQLHNDQWYSSAQLMDILHTSRLGVEGKEIVARNILTWSLAKLGQLERRRVDNSFINLFRILDLGKQLIDTYSTNTELFYDLIHFLFYSTFLRSKDVNRGRFWLYAETCNILWKEAPTEVENSSLTNRLQFEAIETFPAYKPSFSDRSVRGAFPWLQTLSPPFLSKQSNKSQLFSKRRSNCTPQLFHLATDLIYNVMEGVQYGSSLAIKEQQIEDICKVCLLDPERFWNMANLTEMTVNGYEVHQGQWGTSILLAKPPNWITLPDFSNEQPAENEEVFEHGGEE